MNILFDFQHPVDINFFKKSILILKKQNHNIFLTFRPRGNLEKILKYELPGFPTFAFGKHGKNLISKLIYNFLREIELLNFYRIHNIKLTCGFGPLTTISSKIYGIPSLAFEDDFEYKINFYYAKLFATRHIMPSIFPTRGKNVFHYKGFKELAYLHPDYYSPDISILKEYNLSENEYVFIREVSAVSLNYQNKKSHLIEIIEIIQSHGLEIVLSIEDKSVKNHLQKNCIILEEPVKDINSLLAFAAITITSGDTMARESSLLGTLTIYTGNRDMLIHKIFYDIGIMYNELSVSSIAKRLSSVLKIKKDIYLKFKIDEMIKNNWDNTTEIILNNIYDFLNEDRNDY